MTSHSIWKNPGHLKSKQNGNHHADNIFKYIVSFYQNATVIFPKGPIEHNPSFVQVMARCCFIVSSKWIQMFVYPYTSDCLTGNG